MFYLRPPTRDTRTQVHRAALIACALLASLALGCSGDDHRASGDGDIGTRDGDDTAGATPTLEGLLGTVADSALPWAIHDDVLQPRNLYTQRTYNTLNRCPDDGDLDGDGRSGCDDPQCWTEPFATATNICYRTDALVDREEWGPAECGDGLDNDNDGLIDCDDDNSCDCGSPLHDTDGLLIGVAALPRLVAVVFPPADREGFDLAVGGLHTPWYRVPVTDLPLSSVGDVVAAGSPEGRVWMAFRELAAPEALHLYSWTESDGVREHAISRDQGPSLTPEYFARCPDLELLVDGDGMLDLFYRQSHANGESAVLRAHGDGLSGQWATTPVTESRPIGTTDDLEHTGCETLAAYDDFGRPQVLVMKHRFDPDNPPVEGQFPIATLSSAEGLFEDAEGGFRRTRIPDLLDWSPINGRIFTPTSPEVFGPGASITQWGMDVDTITQGYLIAGPTPRQELGTGGNRAYADFRFLPSTLRYAFDRRDANPLPGSSFYDVFVGTPWMRGWGLKIGVNGNLLLAPNPGVDEYVDDLVISNPPFGVYPGRVVAPAAMSQMPQLYPVFARGRRAFDVGVCLAPDTHELVVCAGGVYRPNLESNLQAAATEGWPDPPRLVASSVRDGDDDVPTTLGTISLTLDLRGNDDADVDIYLTTAVGRGFTNFDEMFSEVDYSVDRLGGGRFEIRIGSQGLEPDTRYAISVVDERLRAVSDPYQELAWLLTDFEPAQIRFRTGVGGYPDPRDGERLRCDDSQDGSWVRDEDGTCRDTQVLPWTATRVSLRPVIFDLETADGATPWLENPAGQRVDGQAVRPTGNRRGWEWLELNGPIAAPSGNCCSEVCNAAGICGEAECLAQTESCSADAECCSGLCDPTTETCVRCRPDEADCGDDAECCTGRCSDGVCGVPSCGGEGASCLGDVDCCDGPCAGGLCVALGCLTDGSPCADDGDCCQGTICEDVGSGDQACRSSFVAAQCVADGDPCMPGGGGLWELHYPDGIATGVGAPIHPDDLVFRFTVEQPPLHLAATLPADGDTAVPVDTDIVLTFDGPAIFTTGGGTEPVELVAEGSGTSVNLSPIQESPMVWRLLHPPLEPATSYAMTLTQFIRSAANTPFADAPVTVRFETSP